MASIAYIGFGINVRKDLIAPEAVRIIATKACTAAMAALGSCAYSRARFASLTLFPAT